MARLPAKVAHNAIRRRDDCCRLAPPSFLSFSRYPLTRHLSRHHPTGPTPAALHVEDLYLACACAVGCDAALLAFERRYLSQVDHFLPPGDRTPAFLDELRQSSRWQAFMASRELKQWASSSSMMVSRMRIR